MSQSRVWQFIRTHRGSLLLAATTIACAITSLLIRKHLIQPPIQLMADCLFDFVAVPSLTFVALPVLALIRVGYRRRRPQATPALTAGFKTLQIATVALLFWELIEVAQLGGPIQFWSRPSNAVEHTINWLTGFLGHSASWDDAIAYVLGWLLTAICLAQDRHQPTPAQPSQSPSLQAI